MSSRKDLRNNRTSGFHIPMSDADSAGYGGEKIPDAPVEPMMPRQSLVVQLKDENTDLRSELEDLRQQLQSRTSSLLVQDGTLLVHDFQFTSKGLIAPESFDPQAWDHVGSLLFKLEGSLQWLIGDWLVYGVERKYGEIADFAARFGREEKTLYDYVYVANNVQFSVRTENLTFGHHKLVAALNPDQQAEALNYAAEQGLSVASFRKWLRGEDDQPALLAPSNTSSTKTDQLYDTYHADIRRYLFNRKAVKSLSPQKRQEVIQQLEWYVDIHAAFLRELKNQDR